MRGRSGYGNRSYIRNRGHFDGVDGLGYLFVLLYAGSGGSLVDVWKNEYCGCADTSVKGVRWFMKEGFGDRSAAHTGGGRWVLYD